jgi:hypothetical protein
MYKYRNLLNLNSVLVWILVSMMKPAVVIGATILVGGYITIWRYMPTPDNTIHKYNRNPVCTIERCVSENYTGKSDTIYGVSNDIDKSSELR